MPKGRPVVVSAAVEGVVDESVVRRLVQEAGASLERVYGRNGKRALRRAIHGYNRGAHYSPWVVLIDLNHEADCAPPVREIWLPDAAPQMCFRIAVREVESWLFADWAGLSEFLRVSASRIPSEPEAVEHPKQTMVGLAGQSRSSEIRQDMTPRLGSGRSIGPAYTSRLIEFVERRWHPAAAAKKSESLRRCRKRLAELVASLEVIR